MRQISERHPVAICGRAGEAAADLGRGGGLAGHIPTFPDMTAASAGAGPAELVHGCAAGDWSCSASTGSSSEYPTPTTIGSHHSAPKSPCSSPEPIHDCSARVAHAHAHAHATPTPTPTPNPRHNAAGSTALARPSTNSPANPILPRETWLDCACVAGSSFLVALAGICGWTARTGGPYCDRFERGPLRVHVRWASIRK